MTYDLTNWSPPELGLPAQFTDFREEQIPAVEAICNTSARTFLGSMPTGFGKSLVIAAAAKALGMRTVVVTGTKALQEQYLRDFREMGMVDIRGKANYPCALVPHTTCKQGGSSNCPLVKGGGCTYESARDCARGADLIVTNYAYWVRSLEYPERGLHSMESPVEMLVLDEGHRAVEELSKCLQKSLRETWLTTARLSSYPKDSEEISTWVKWAHLQTESVEAARRSLSKSYREAKSPLRLTQLQQLEDLQESLESMCRMDSNRWVCEQRKGTNYGRVWDFHPIWPAQFAERYLFGGIEKLVIVSATLRPMTAGMLGLAKESYEFREWPRIFPPQYAPVYHYSPGKLTRLKFNSSDEDLERWLGRIDDILEKRNDRKGIIHTVSYARQQYLLANSRWRSRFIANTSDPDSPSALEVVETFRASSEPLVLVSPSVGTGWDFPGSQAEFAIIAKIPFPEMKSKLMKARIEKNKRYPMYLAMQELVQSAGRVNRTPSDRAEVFMVDDSVKWFWYQNKSLAPAWFGYREIKEMPPAPRSELKWQQ